MAEKRYVDTLTLYLTEDFKRQLEDAYQSSHRALKRNAKGHWIHKSKSAFVTDLVTVALDNDATSRLVLAGKVGKQISLKLDNVLILLRVLIDLFCRFAKITDVQKNEAFKRAAADVQFEERLTDLRAFYRAKLSETGTPEDEMGTKRDKI